MIDLTVHEIRRKLQEADAAEFAVLERSLVADTRKGVRTAVEAVSYTHLTLPTNSRV